MPRKNKEQILLDKISNIENKNKKFEDIILTLVNKVEAHNKFYADAISKLNILQNKLEAKLNDGTTSVEKKSTRRKRKKVSSV